jgi:D-glycero-D-manno-heptose 1,7-bisphosphate phosphatase
MNSDRPRRPAVFLDRDGTLIEELPYLSDPASVRLLSGAAEAIKLLRASGYVTVIATNQSAVGRGLITEERLNEIHLEMRRQLEHMGAELDAIYYCTTAPSRDDASKTLDSRRKPSPGMLLDAANDLALDLASSWMVGDMIRDLEAAWNAGCPGRILVRTGKGATQESLRLPWPFQVVDNVLSAAQLIVNTPRKIVLSHF